MNVVIEAVVGVAGLAALLWLVAGTPSARDIRRRRAKARRE
jgi:hypothetical protein